MNRNYTRIAIIIVVIFTLVSSGYSLAQIKTETAANYDLGIAAYERGHYTVALYDFETRANQGDKVAQFCLAYMLKHGMGVRAPKPNEALKWYEKSAEQGYAPAQNNLGFLYVRRAEATKSQDLKMRNLKNAEKWFKLAAEQGYAPAQFNLYIILDKQEVLDWLVKAAKQGYAPAQNQLGATYSLGSFHFNLGGDIPIDLQAAAEWYEKAADQGYGPAQGNLGTYYEAGKGVKQNYAKAFKLYKGAAEQEFAVGQFSLALCYHYGIGVPKNSAEAFRWFFSAAENGHVGAQNNLGAIYAKRYAKSQKDEDAEMSDRWHFRSAQQGDTLAQSSFGTRFEEALHEIPQDKEEAYFWYSLALQNIGDFENAENKDVAIRVTEARDRIRKSLKSRQISELEKRVKNWKPKQLHSSGTGFYISKHYILTNAHVVIDSSSDNEFNEFRIPYKLVELIAYDKDVDLALLYDKKGNTDMATFRPQPVKFGEKVSIFGYPQSHALSYKGNITDGIISGTSYLVNRPQHKDLFQYTAPVQRGNSGGPVFDGAGNVIGVCSTGYSYYDKVFTKDPSISGDWLPDIINLAQNINFAIKSSVVKEFISNVKTRLDLALDFPVQTEFHFGFDKDDNIQVPSISLPEQRAQAEKFTVPVICYKNKVEPPLEVAEIRIEELEQYAK